MSSFQSISLRDESVLKERDSRGFGSYLLQQEQVFIKRMNLAPLLNVLEHNYEPLPQTPDLLTYRMDLWDLKDVPLTMAPDSYDDQYSGCSSAVENKLMDTSTDGFNTTYHSVWENAANHWKKIKGSFTLPSGFKDDYGIAIIAYTNVRYDLYTKFNIEILTGGQSYKSSFHFKSFHFLLTKAIKALKTTQPGCYDVFRGVEGVRFAVSDPNNLVRFGQFASSSLSETVAKGFGQDTFFTIKTCHGAKISNFSIFPEQEEVLIPPYEMFMFVESKDETQITLHSLCNMSNFNCQSKRGMDLRALAALRQIDDDYQAVMCNGRKAARCTCTNHPFM
ncbi:erythroblast NAD(P)(+)--arginine ADP-ribosyltransferase-like [Anolis sagrei]|uniref:erythroblast NAD(P)(+)--arginine ADP-ribosyltransferase-like n=1 Tax=Anolis sagrei TaxID=38937 RepID=UPI0035201C84